MSSLQQQQQQRAKKKRAAMNDDGHWSRGRKINRNTIQFIAVFFCVEPIVCLSVSSFHWLVHSWNAVEHVENKFSFMFGKGQAIWSTDNYFVFIGSGIIFTARRLRNWPAFQEEEWELEKKKRNKLTQNGSVCLKGISFDVYGNVSI